MRAHIGTESELHIHVYRLHLKPTHPDQRARKEQASIPGTQRGASNEITALVLVRNGACESSPMESQEVS